VQGRRRAVQAGHDLGRAGGNRLKRLCDAGQVGRQRAHAHHRAARSRRTLAAVMMRGRGRVLRGGLVMRMRPGVVMRGAVMRVAGLHLVMHRHEVGKKHVVKARCRTIAQGEACGRREHAEQIGEGNEAPHPDPHRSCQSQQHSADMLFARQCCTR
jgi:hypothetical protein